MKQIFGKYKYLKYI